LLAFGLLGRAAVAEDHEADAERLFREGQRLLEERRYAEACPKFEQAYGKDRQLGTLLNLAFCHKEQGALWYAWLEFREAEVKATELGRSDRRDFARQRLLELDRLLPRVVVDGSPRVALTEVLVEDRKVWEAERGAPFAAEQGLRKFVFRARGKKPVTALINVGGAGKVQHVAVPEMADASPDPPPAPPPAALAPAARSAAEPSKAAEAGPKPDPGGTSRTLGFVSLGVGAAAAAAGTITGLVTLGSPCAGNTPCSQDERRAATTMGAVSTVSFVAAGLGLVGGALLVLTAPSAGAVRSGGGRLQLGLSGLSGAF
jgi:hypothetical protein